MLSQSEANASQGTFFLQIFQFQDFYLLIGYNPKKNIFDSESTKEVPIKLIQFVNFH